MGWKGEGPSLLSAVSSENLVREDQKEGNWRGNREPLTASATAVSYTSISGTLNPSLPARLHFGTCFLPLPVLHDSNACLPVWVVKRRGRQARAEISMAGGREASGRDLKGRRHPCRCLSAAPNKAFGASGFKLVGFSGRSSFGRRVPAKLRVRKLMEDSNI